VSVLSRAALESSPLADLHALASELGIDGFRRLRREELVEAIVAHQSGGGDDASLSEEIVDEAATDVEARPRRRRGGRGRAKAEPEDDAPTVAEAEVETELVKEPAVDDEEPPRGRQRERDRERIVEGTVELLSNGSGFIRLAPPDASDDDVYISAAQVRRCELVSGDRVSGPVRRPRRSERFPSLVRVDTINGAPAEEVAEGTPFDELPCMWPAERIALEGDDPTLRAIGWLTPFGRGSRVTITGGPGAGKSETLRRIAGDLGARDDLEVSVVLAGVRPEEIGDWAGGPVQPAVALPFATTAETQLQAIERTLETARRVAARGGHAAVLIDSLDSLDADAAQRALAGARAIVDGGSLTVIAVSTLPVGGETTVIAFDAQLTRAGRVPGLDMLAGGTLRPERLVGEDGARAIEEARADALAQRGT
jgi:transcription termination factor Rho